MALYKSIQKLNFRLIPRISFVSLRFFAASPARKRNIKQIAFKNYCQSCSYPLEFCRVLNCPKIERIQRDIFLSKKSLVYGKKGIGIVNLLDEYQSRVKKKEIMTVLRKKMSCAVFNRDFYVQVNSFDPKRLFNVFFEDLKVKKNTLFVLNKDRKMAVPLDFKEKDSSELENMF